MTRMLLGLAVAGCVIALVAEMRELCKKSLLEKCSMPHRVEVWHARSAKTHIEWQKQTRPLLITVGNKLVGW